MNGESRKGDTKKGEFAAPLQGLPTCGRRYPGRRSRTRYKAPPGGAAERRDGMLVGPSSHDSACCRAHLATATSGWDEPLSLTLSPLRGARESAWRLVAVSGCAPCCRFFGIWFANDGQSDYVQWLPWKFSKVCCDCPLLFREEVALDGWVRRDGGGHRPPLQLLRWPWWSCSPGFSRPRRGCRRGGAIRILGRLRWPGRRRIIMERGRSRGAGRIFWGRMTGATSPAKVSFATGLSRRWSRGC